MYFTSRPSRAEMSERARSRRVAANNRQTVEHERIEERRRQIESISAQSIRDQETAPLEQAQAEFEQSFRTLVEQQQATIFTAPDPYGVVEPLPPTYGLVNAQTIQDHDTLNYELFQKARPQYFECPENIKTLKRYFAANRHEERLTAKTFIAAYDRLNDLGHMLTAEQIVQAAQQAAQPKVAPAPSYVMGDGRALSKRIIDEMDPTEYRRRVNHDAAFRDASEYLLGGTAQSPQPAAPAPATCEWGWDPSGEKVFKTNREVDRMSPDEYKRFTRASIKTNPFAFRGER